MSSVEHWRHVSAIFHAVTDAPTAERDRILSELCGPDSGLKAEICALLAAHDSTGSFLDQVPGELLHAHLRSGDTLCDRFVVGRHLGTGGMGEVWAAHDTQLNEDIAIKTVRDSLTINASSLMRLKREIQLARRIAHPNVCRVHELFEDASGTSRRLFLTMELVEGETLSSRLRRDGRIPVDEALAIVRQIIAGLSAAHAANVVHRDLKPSNVMLTSAPAGRVVIMDFGLARLFETGVAENTATAVTAIVGTPDYMAPEQIAGSVATAATDVYALGLLLFEMLKGERPFGSGGTFDSWLRRAREKPARLTSVVPGVSRRIDDVIVRCLEYEPGKRFRSVDEVWSALQRRLMPLPRGASSRIAAAAAAAVAAIVVWQGAQWWRAPVAPSPDAVQLHAQAMRELAEGASVRALNSNTRALAAAPHFAMAQALQAEIFLELDTPVRAKDALLVGMSGASTLTGSDADYLSGIRALVVNNCDDAIASLKRYGQSGGTGERPYRLLTVARALERCDRPDEARDVLAQAAAIDPTNAFVLVRQARLFTLQPDYKTALEVLGRAEALFQSRTNYEGICEVLLARGAAQAAQNDLQGAAATLTRAATTAEDLGDLRQQVRVRLQTAAVERRRGDLERAKRLTGDAIALARRQNLDSLTLQGLLENGNVFVSNNLFEEARDNFTTARDIAENHRNERVRAEANRGLASVYQRTMQPGKVEDALQLARPYFEAAKQQRTLLQMDLLLGQAKISKTQYEAARDLLNDIVDRALSNNDRQTELTARDTRATAFAALGDYQKALEEYRRVLQASQETGQQRLEWFTRLNIADTLSNMGQFLGAATALSQIDGPDDVNIQAQMLWVRASDALRRGGYAEAQANAVRALAVGERRSVERTVRANLIACAALAHLKQKVDAERHCAEARNTPGIEGLPRLWREVQLLDAQVKLVTGNVAAIDDRQIQALTDAADGSKPNADTWRALALLAAIRSGPAAEAARAALTRYRDDLRLSWQEADYQPWRQRADVTWFLGRAGVS